MTKDKFEEKHNPTIGAEFGSCLFNVEGQVLKLQIWDTVGQESFKSVTKIFYRTANAVILTYSINNLESFNSLKGWLAEVKDSCYPDVIIFMVGNKQDLESQRQVSREKARAFQVENNIKYWTEASAKSGDNINQLFVHASKFMYTVFS